MLSMQTMSNIRRDFVATHLRSQINSLGKILEHIEKEKDFEFDYADESLKGVENNLRQLRKICSEG